MSASWRLVVGYGACLAPFVGAVAYEIYIAAWPWRSQRFETSDGDLFLLRSKRRPPPVGTCTYPAGRVLLEWCLMEPLPTGHRIVEIGSGTGGLAIALSRCRPDLDLTATDRCEAAVANLRLNVQANTHAHRIRVIQLDAAEATTLDCDMLLAADLAYHGGLDLPLPIQGHRGMRMVQVDRWSGGAVAAIAAGAGLASTSSTTRDPHILAFERSNPSLNPHPLSEKQRLDLKRRVFAALPLADRVSWHLLGTFDSMCLYEKVPEVSSGKCMD